MLPSGELIAAEPLQFLDKRLSDVLPKVTNHNGNPIQDVIETFENNPQFDEIHSLLTLINTPATWTQNTQLELRATEKWQDGRTVFGKYYTPYVLQARIDNKDILIHGVYVLTDYKETVHKTVISIVDGENEDRIYLHSRDVKKDVTNVVAGINHYAQGEITHEAIIDDGSMEATEQKRKFIDTIHLDDSKKWNWLRVTERDTDPSGYYVPENILERTSNEFDAFLYYPALKQYSQERMLKWIEEVRHSTLYELIPIHAGLKLLSFINKVTHKTESPDDDFFSILPVTPIMMRELFTDMNIEPDTVDFSIAEKPEFVNELYNALLTYLKSHPKNPEVIVPFLAKLAPYPQFRIVEIINDAIEFRSSYGKQYLDQLKEALVPITEKLNSE